MHGDAVQCLEIHRFFEKGDRDARIIDSGDDGRAGVRQGDAASHGGGHHLFAVHDREENIILGNIFRSFNGVNGIMQNLLNRLAFDVWINAAVLDQFGQVCRILFHWQDFLVYLK